MDAKLSRLAAVAFQSPLWLTRTRSNENLTEQTITELIEAKTFANANPETISGLKQAAQSLDWAERNRILDWSVNNDSLNKVMRGWAENPLQCPNLPIANRDRYPDIDWKEPLEIGTIEDDRLIALGKERGTETLVVSRDNGQQPQYFATYLYELFAHAQGKITLKEGFEEAFDLMETLNETQPA